MDIPSWWPSKKPYIIGDCLEGMKKIPDNTIDLIITSPPYNNGASGLWGHLKPKKYGKYSDDMSQEEYCGFLQSFLTEGMRIVKKHIFLNVLMSTGNKEALIELIFHNRKSLKDILYWIKTNPPAQIQSGILSPGVEWILIFSKETPNDRCFRGIGKPGNWIPNNIITPVAKSVDGHGAIFPLSIPTWLIKTFSFEGDIVLDPFLGSGTTLLACRETGHLGLGFEINPEYEPIIRKRYMANVMNIEGFEQKSV